MSVLSRNLVSDILSINQIVTFFRIPAFSISLPSITTCLAKIETLAGSLALLIIVTNAIWQKSFR